MRFCSLLLLAGLAVAETPQYQVVATTRQLMAAVQKPAMDSLSAMIKAGGPKDDQEWGTAQQNAAVLAEAAQLLNMGSRPLDQDVWIKSSAKLQEAAIACSKAAEAKDAAAFKTSMATVGGACRSCHTVHRKKQQ